MAVPASLLVICGCVWGFCHVEASLQTLSSVDSSFCHGGLKVIYPELDIDRCLVIPKELRIKISTIWQAPEVYFPQAHEKKMYVLVMVDPDAPSRSSPSSANWRHWLVMNIQGKELHKGEIKGTTITSYAPPTPPQKTGFHRYQFMLFEQPADAPVTPTLQVDSYRGKWDLQAFISRFDAGKPVATVQFLTQNYKD